MAGAKSGNSPRTSEGSTPTERYEEGDFQGNLFECRLQCVNKHLSVLLPGVIINM